jgi:hypothetical protein
MLVSLGAESSSLLSKNIKIKIYRTKILPVVFYGCETWSLTLREKLRLRVFEKRVLRKIFGARRDGVTGEWRKLHNEELNDLYCSPSIVRVIKSKRIRWAGHVARMGKRRDVYRILVRKHEEKRLLGRPRRGWEDNINSLSAELNSICHLLALLGAHTILHISGVRVKMGLQEVGRWDMD